MDPSLDALADEQAIRDVLARYWRGIDRADSELVRGAYHPGAYDDHGYYQGPVEGFVETLPTQVWPNFERTQHFSGHIAVELLGDGAARSEAYAEAHHIVRNPDGSSRDLVYGLRYVDRFERRDGEWRIAHRVCVWDWHRIDDAERVELPEACFRGALDPSDPVYSQPAPSGRPLGAGDLVAQQACYDALMRCARGLDRGDAERVRSAHHPGARVDCGAYRGDIEGFCEWLGESLSGRASCTFHKLGNVLITVDGERAYGETYAIVHRVGGEASAPQDLILGLRYLDRFECRGGEWRIAERQVSYEWERRIPLGPQQLAEGYRRGRRDGGDPVQSWKAPVVRSEQEALARLADRSAIYAQLVGYCRGVDRCDEALVRSAYHTDAYDDHGAYRGGVDGFIGFVQRDVQARFRCTMHKLGHALIEVDGDVARSETYAIGHHVRAQEGRDVDDYVMGIRYLDRFERRAGEWRIAERELRFEWQRLDPLRALDPNWTLGRHDPSDPVYE